MIRLAISVEGQTEEEFSKSILTTHLRSHGIELQPVLLGRARSHSTGGGNVSVVRLASEMEHLYHSFDAVTSLVDFYGFRDKRDNTAEELEALIRDTIQRRLGASQERVLPYVQMHEFEGLLFSDAQGFLVMPHATPETVGQLRDIRARFATPEDINDNTDTAPSRRINQIFQHYRKALHGPLVASEIGLGAITALATAASRRSMTSGRSSPSSIRNMA